MTENILTQADAKSLFRYDSKTGFLYWRKAPAKYVAAGDRAGCLCGGYIRIGIHGVLYLAHRIIWLMAYGSWPHEIDHINGIKHDNKLENLRNVDRLENGRNQRKSKSNTSGVTGVHWNINYNRWYAYIGVNGKMMHLYCGSDFTEACRLRKEAEKKYGFHENHGNTIQTLQRSAH